MLFKRFFCFVNKSSRREADRGTKIHTLKKKTFQTRNITTFSYSTQPSTHDFGVNAIDFNLLHTHVRPTNMVMNISPYFPDLNLEELSIHSILQVHMMKSIQLFYIKQFMQIFE